MGAAYMFNYTNGAPIWEQRIRDILKGMEVYFVQSAGKNSPAAYPKPGGQIMAEVACEFSAQQSCNQDEPSFKAYTSRWLAQTIVLAPFTKPLIWPLLQASAQAAAGQCIGTVAGQTPGTTCGRRWYQTTWDGFSGLGEQMSAMSIFQSLLLINHTTEKAATNPLTVKTGGKSKGDAGAGNGGPKYLTDDGPWLSKPITVADKVGASILTALGAGAAIGTSYFMIV
jgi:mannan endo-1,6-alpha-mannosidase